MHIFSKNVCQIVSIIHTLEYLPDYPTVDDVLKNRHELRRIQCIYDDPFSMYMTYLH